MGSVIQPVISNVIGPVIRGLVEPISNGLQYSLGWTGLVSCGAAAAGITTIKLNGSAEWTISTGWTLSIDGGESHANVPLTATYISPSNLLEFDVPWSVAPIAGQIVLAQYNGSGNFKTEGGVSPEDDMQAMPNPKTVVNCLDIPSNVIITETWTGLKNCGL